MGLGRPHRPCPSRGVTRSVACDGHGLWREYEGSVEDWMTQSKRAREIAAQSAADSPTPAPVAAPPAPAAAAAPRPGTRRKLSYKEQRELETLPARIAELEEEQKRITEVLELDGGAIYASEASRAAELAQRHAQIDEELLAAMERWEELDSARQG